MKTLHVFVMVIQTILHYLGCLGILLGIVALIFGNTARGIELFIGGVVFIVIKYVIGFIFLLAVGKEKPDPGEADDES
jgi:hydrogenase-4 membrane subunit HyfE